jgi:predicted secreted protein|tara:strand:- start:41 stop:496 length:456 start_codon:yes stop_codon:yes gene_type:complete
MANLTTALNGTDIKIMDSSNNTLVAYAQSGTLNVNMSTRDISNKESSGWTESMEGARNWDVSVDGAYAWVDTSDTELTNSADDMLNTYIGLGSNTRSSVVIRFGTDSTSTGDTFYEGTAWLTAFSVSAPTEDTATYSLSFTGTGALTVTVA